jgi:hypothetical protein
VAAESLRFGVTGDEHSLWKLANGQPACERGDVNKDGRPDLTCAFVTRSTGLSRTDFAAILSGATVAGVPIEGREGITVSTK